MTGSDTLEIPLAEARECTMCSGRVAGALRAQPGVEEVRPQDAGTLSVRYDPGRASAEALVDVARSAEAVATETFAHDVVPIEGMDCADCARTIERSVGRLDGVTHAQVSFPAATLRVESRRAAVTLEAIAARIRSLGYRAPGIGGQGSQRWWSGAESITAAAAALLVAALAADLAVGLGLPSQVLYGAAILIGGAPIARSGLVALLTTHRPDIKLLMTIAAVGAVAIGAWTEAALVVVLFSIGEALEGRAVERARRELAGLVSLLPETARIRRAGEEVLVEVARLAIGDEVVVRPGERLPADGRVLEGRSAVDQAAITGESTPVDKDAGDEVFAGTLNAQGRLVVRVGSTPGDTTLARIGRLVSEAQARRAPSERWVDAFARVYTPIVIVGAVLVAAIPPLAFGVDFAEAFYAALALLIIACPCALVLSTPVAIVSALGRASAAGVLVKGGAHLERAASVRTVAFDKTGTLTLGHPRLVEWEAFGMADDEMLGLAAAVERGSEHPLARAIVEAADARGLSGPAPDDFEARTGLGARGVVDGREIVVGDPRLLGDVRLPGRIVSTLARLRRAGRTSVVVARDGEPIGILALADTTRPEAAGAVASLARVGVGRTVLLTGDARAVAEAIASELAIDDVRAELLPGDKAAALATLGAGTAMVGDGVNDAPALAAADLGIAMGTAGSDTAIEVADVALMGDDPRKVAGLIGLARWTRAVVRQNVAVSLATKLAALALLAFGALPLWAAVASDVGASLVVVANGLRLARSRPGGRGRARPLLSTTGPLKEGGTSGPAGAPAIASERGCEDASCIPDPIAVFRKPIRPTASAGHAEDRPGLHSGDDEQHD